MSAMLAAMAHRGPHGRTAWADGRAALGHCRLRIGDGPAGPMPLGDDDGLVVTADARLDHQDDLRRSLGLDNAGPDGGSDEALILHAYRRWGQGCVERLDGDFAFAIWDGRRGILFCARDRFGVKPLYYAVRPDWIAVATEIKALFALSGVPRDVDEEWVADYLVPFVPDAAATPYHGIRSLPPRHRMTATADGVTVDVYWSLEASAPPPPADRAAAFRDLFVDSVRRRMSGARRVGAMLSGGLDSSSIVCAARAVQGPAGPPLPTFSMTFSRTPAWDEAPFINAVLRQGGLDPHMLPSDDSAPLGGMDGLLAEQDGVFHAIGLAQSRRVYEAARDAGVDVLLDGHGGDEVVSYGGHRLDELAQAGRWLRLWRELSGVVRHHGGSRTRRYAAYVLRYGPPALRRGHWRYRQVRARLAARRPAAGDGPVWSRLLSRDLIARTGVADRHAAHRRVQGGRPQTEQAAQLAIVTDPLQAYALETLDRAAAAFAIEPRYPFWDRRLLEFCLSLPAEEKLRDGLTRVILRRGMDGLLPPEIQWRPDKLDFSPHLVRGMLGHHRALLDDVVRRDLGGVGRYVDLAVLGQAYERLVADGTAASGADAMMLWRAATLALWLRQVEAAPVARRPVPDRADGPLPMSAS